jgi:hypothetical protein
MKYCSSQEYHGTVQIANGRNYFKHAGIYAGLNMLAYMHLFKKK